MQHKQENFEYRKIEKSVAWISPFLGRGGHLMYMEPLLTAFSERCTKFCAITAECTEIPQGIPFKIHLSSAVRRLYWHGKNNYMRGFTFIGPTFTRTILSSKAEVLFLVEFSLTTIYGIIVKMLKRPVKIVLVMESRPIPNEGILLAYAKMRIRKFIVSKADAILTNNRAGRDFLVNKLGADLKRIVAKPYLVSISNRDNTPSSNMDKFHALGRSSVIRFLYVGQLIHRKGIHHLINSVSLLSVAEKSRVHVDVVGDGDYKNALQSLVREYGLDDSFQFHGSISYNELPKFYSAAHLFVSPTLRDYRALAPFEALSARLPIISSIHDGGVTENVIEGENGYFCDPRNHEKLASILHRILSAPEMLANFSLKSAEMAKDYTIENAVNNMLFAAVLACKQH